MLFSGSINLYEVFTYNKVAIMSLRSRSHVNASMVLMRADHFVYTIIYNHMFEPILLHMRMISTHAYALAN